MVHSSIVLTELKPLSDKFSKEMSILFIRMLHKAMKEQHNVTPVTDGVF